MLHPLSPSDLAVLAADGRPGMTLEQVASVATAITQALDEAWNDPAVADFHAAREEEYRQRFDPQHDALEESDRAYFEEGGTAL